MGIAGLIPKLRSAEFTTIAVMDPDVHPLTRSPSAPGPFRRRNQHPRERNGERLREILEDQEDEQPEVPGR
jgi:hypothetical protein